jgi:hypothetical protein
MATKGTKKPASKKSLAKKPPAKKDATGTVNQKTLLPSPEFTADLTQLFKKHGFAGLPRHLSFASDDQCDRICPDGSRAVPTWINCPGGVTKMVCACPGEDPSCD